MIICNKEVIKEFSFFFKVHDSLPLCDRGGMQDIFLLFRKAFNIDQYDFGLVLLSNSLLDRREKYFYLDSSIEVLKCA